MPAFRIFGTTALRSTLIEAMIGCRSRAGPVIAKASTLAGVGVRRWLWPGMRRRPTQSAPARPIMRCSSKRRPSLRRKPKNWPIAWLRPATDRQIATILKAGGNLCRAIYSCVCWKVRYGTCPVSDSSFCATRPLPDQQWGPGRCGQ